MYYITFVGVVRWQNSETQNFEFKEVFSHISIVSLHCFSMQHLFQGIVHIKRIYFHWWYAKKNSFDSVGLVYKLHIFALKIYLWVECTLTFIFSEYWASSSECVSVQAALEEPAVLVKISHFLLGVLGFIAVLFRFYCGVWNKTKWTGFVLTGTCP